MEKEPSPELDFIAYELAHAVECQTITYPQAYRIYQDLAKLISTTQWQVE